VDAPEPHPRRCCSAHVPRNGSRLSLARARLSTLLRTTASTVERSAGHPSAAAALGAPAARPAAGAHDFDLAAASCATTAAISSAALAASHPLLAGPSPAR